MREKIESQELFVPKEERKVSNLVNQKQEMSGMVQALQEENRKLQD